MKIITNINYNIICVYTFDFLKVALFHLYIHVLIIVK